jgi:hypothetical protein
MAKHDTNLTLARLALIGAGALLAAATVAGCQRDGGAAGHPDTGSARHGEQFPRDTDTRPLDRFVAVQTANGARADATLTVDHFDGHGTLNSLGRRKLDLMLQADEPLPLVVCLDLSRAAAGARAAGAAPLPADVYRQSVRAYLADRGVDESQVELRHGPNAARTHMARGDIRSLNEMRGNDKGPADGPAESNPHALSANDLMTGASSK